MIRCCTLSKNKTKRRSSTLSKKKTKRRSSTATDVKVTKDESILDPVEINLLKPKFVHVLFDEWGEPRLEMALRKSGIYLLTSTQVAVLSEYLNRDLYVSSPKGSGKRLAYASRILDWVGAGGGLQALVLVPESDFDRALQIKRVFDHLGSVMQKSIGMVGMTDLSVEEENCMYVNEFKKPRMRVNVLITTCSRLKEHVSYGHGFSLENVDYIVCDEAENVMDEVAQMLPERDPHGIRLIKIVVTDEYVSDPTRICKLGLYHPKLLVARPKCERISKKSNVADGSE